jgi:hypothetical protein
MFARRAVFILTPPEGRVAYAWTSRLSLLQPDYDEVVRVANEISSKLPKA